MACLNRQLSFVTWWEADSAVAPMMFGICEGRLKGPQEGDREQPQIQGRPVSKLHVRAVWRRPRQRHLYDHATFAP